MNEAEATRRLLQANVRPKQLNSTKNKLMAGTHDLCTTCGFVVARNPAHQFTCNTQGRTISLDYLTILCHTPSTHTTAWVGDALISLHTKKALTQIPHLTIGEMNAYHDACVSNQHLAAIFRHLNSITEATTLSDHNLATLFEAQYAIA